MSGTRSRRQARGGLRTASGPIAGGGLDVAKNLFSDSGRWATQMLKKAVLEGRELSSQALRTLDTLRHEEWKIFDDAVIEESLIRLRGVADLIGAGLTKTIPNALGTTVFGYERLTMADAAFVSLDGLSATANDTPEFDLNQIPLPITHKDFFLNLRKLAGSRKKGESLDTTGARQAGRVVAEMAEQLLFQGGPTFGGLKTYGYTTFPDRITAGFDGTKNWGDTTKAGSSYLKDVTVGLAALAAKRQYGPFMIYVDTAAGVQLENDYNAGTANTQTIRQRLQAIDGIAGIRTADQLTANNVIFVQMTMDNVCWLQGEPLQTVQWDEGGGFRINFKVWQIAVPLIRSDIKGRCGIYHLS